MIKVNTTIFDRRMRKLHNLPNDVVEDAYPYYKKITPKDKGNARKRTEKVGLKLKSNYAYAGRLDEGWSKQAPKGMTAPTIDKMEDIVNDIVKRV